MCFSRNLQKHHRVIGDQQLRRPVLVGGDSSTASARRPWVFDERGWPRVSAAHLAPRRGMAPPRAHRSRRRAVQDAELTYSTTASSVATRRSRCVAGSTTTSAWATSKNQAASDVLRQEKSRHDMRCAARGRSDAQAGSRRTSRPPSARRPLVLSGLRDGPRSRSVYDPQRRGALEDRFYSLPARRRRSARPARRCLRERSARMMPSRSRKALSTSSFTTR